MMAKCKGGSCKVNKLSGPRLNARLAAARQAQAPAAAPVNMPASQNQGVSMAGPVLPPNLVNQSINPAVINPASISNGPVRNPLAAPLMNLQKGNYKSSPYMRKSHGPENIVGSTLKGAEYGSAFGPEGLATGAGAGLIFGLSASAKDWGINLKVKKAVKRLNDLLFRPNQNDPEVQRKILKYQSQLNEIAPGMLAPGQERLPVEQQQQIVDRSVEAAKARGSEAPSLQQYLQNNVNGGGSGGGSNGNHTLQFPNFTAQQVGLQNELINRIGQNKAEFEPIAQQELRRYKEETLPHIAEQYFGNNPDSFGSAYPSALGKSAASLGERLAGMKSQYEAQREHGYMQGALQPAFGNVFIPGVNGSSSGGSKRDNSFVGKMTSGWQDSIPKLVDTFSGMWKEHKEKKAEAAEKAKANDASPDTGIMPSAARMMQGAEMTPVNPSYSPYLQNPNQPSQLSQQNLAARDPLQQLLMKQNEDRNNMLGGRTR